MYDKIEIIKGDANEIINHLKMNGYHFHETDNKNIIFVYEEETSYVETILYEHNCKYRIND